MKSIAGLASIVFVLLFSSACSTQKTGPAPEWPKVSKETRPWARWWWMGSAVDSTNLTYNMENLKKEGFGGVELTAIYGVKGYEKQFRTFESPDWMKMLEYTLKEGQRLDLGVDMANASGWPFGGNWVQADDACKNVQFKQYTLKGGERLKEKVEYIQHPIASAVGHRIKIEDIKFPISSNPDLQKLALNQIRFKKPLPLQALMAYSDDGTTIDLTDKVGSNGILNWTATAGNWKLYAVFQGWHGKMVERAGKGGEGNVIDHFSPKAIKDYLAHFDENAKGIDLNGLRAFFNDSYEVDDARGESDWTPLFFQEFNKRRGYDLRDYLPALFGNDSEEMNSRVLCDYRETISDLLLDGFTKNWAAWAKSHGKKIRNQAHGSPANILDLYEASDIPETEGTDPIRIKMATSAGHVSAKPLISCEAATWLDEHFKGQLSEVKQNLDRYLANGVNHIVYHGSPYSPKDAPWPGWMFYAAVHFAPTNSWWPDLKVINHYVANCQSFMQNSKPDNDVLVYFPIYDRWSEKGRSMLPHFGESHPELTRDLSEELLKEGYTYDYVSDHQIQELSNNEKLIKAPGASYKAILVPSCEYIPLETMQKLMELADAGATVIFQHKLPVDVPGLGKLKARQKTYDDLVSSLSFQSKNDFSVCEKGTGELLVGDQMESMLKQADVKPEELATLGVWFNRVKRPEGICYFISNWSGKKIDRWVAVQSHDEQAVLFDPMQKTMGKAKTMRLNKGQSEVFLQLEPGQSVILQWYPYVSKMQDYPIWSVSDQKTPITGEWTVSFTKGGPQLPETYQTSSLNSWTGQSDELKKFSGTGSYKISFNKPEGNAPAYLLDLGDVEVSAIVYLNGEKLGTVVGPKYQLTIDATKLKASNELEVQVSNLMANRIIDMDKHGENYKKFYNVNFAAKVRADVGKDGLFTAVHWDPLPSGLLGPVTLTALQPKTVKK